MEKNGQLRVETNFLARILFFVVISASLGLCNVSIKPVPTPPPDGGTADTNTPKIDELQINKALGLNETSILMGDIIYDIETKRFITQDPRGRNAITSPHGLWPQNTVPYIMDSTIEEGGIDAIREAITDYHQFTCVKFVPRTTQKNYVKFTQGQGCSSFVGRTARGEQKVNLHRNCWYKGIVIHELKHALGFFHEQSRSDRDSYVKILYENIETGRENNFDKLRANEIQHLGEPYDYGSIMHYRSKAFSKNGQPTILTLKQGAGDNIGQRSKLSDNDIRQINKLYKCPNVPAPKPTSGTVVYCSFDSNSLCNFKQDQTDDFDWTIQQGPTASAGTGPTTDMSGRGWYIYAESSRPRLQGERAVLLSPNLSGPYCLQFHFHMLGTDIDSLNAYKKSGSRRTVIFSVSGNQGDLWYSAQASLTGTEQFRVELEAVRGSSYRGDIALDEIKLTPGSCDGDKGVTPSPTESRTTPVSLRTTPTPRSRREVFCNFDAQSLCEFTQGTGDQFDWTLNSGATSSGPSTGPTNDVSSRGYYIYAEASVPRRNGDRARLVSPILYGSYCIRFYYHMYGSSVGKLSVFAIAGAQNTQLVAYNGNQGNTWHLVQAAFSAPQNYQYQVIFEAERGSGWAADIALDEIRFQPRDCGGHVVVTTTLPPPTTQPTTPAATQIDCNFDSQSLCGFTQDTGDNFNWSLHKGRTGSYPTTGPTTDFSGNGYYIYAEASSPRANGDKARLLSPFVTGTTCLLFSYHMNGAQMGTLNLIGKIGSSETKLWSKSGQQGNTWNSLQFRIRTTAQFQVVFEAVRGNGYQSDIALDEISLIPGSCVAANPLAPSTSIPIATTQTVTSATTNRKDPMCPSGWVEHGQSCYKAFKNKFLWQDAKARCQKHGGHLVTINNAKEHIFIINMAATLHGDYVLWIGLRRDSNGSFSHWDNGEPLTFTRWMLGEPNNFFNEENCTKMLRYSGDWLDVTCEGPFAGEHPFVCEMNKQSSKPLPTEKPTKLQCPRGWNKLSNACYRIYGSFYSMSWNQANSVCKASRANLVSISSQSEHKAVWNLMRTRTRSAINYGFWIGLRRSALRRFQWQDGIPLTYTQWSKGRPSNRGLSQDCTYMTSRTGTWFNAPCRHQLPFICKISPPKQIPTPPPVRCGIRKTKTSSSSVFAIGEIVGGKISTPGTWPWQVAIMCKTCQKQDCGGTLVSALHVVTAAHCVSVSEERFISNYKVRLGEHHFDQIDGHEQDINISSVIVHPSYRKAAAFDSDLAIIELASPARMNDHVGPACLQDTSSDFPPGTSCYITGWGRTIQGGSMSAVLREAKVPLVSSQDCKKNYGSASITNNMLCAGILGAGVDACQGDSGGPLVCKKDNNRWYLVGTTSWGWGCAGRYYGVYTNIARFSKWIKAKVK